jgi:hypothetical protein
VPIPATSSAAPRDLGATLLVAGIGTALSRWAAQTVTAIRFALMAAGVALLLRWVAA